MTISSETIGSKVLGTVRFVFATEDVTYIVSSFKIATKNLTTKKDVQNMRYYGGVDTTSTNKNYGGYFVMTKNIVMDYDSSKVAISTYNYAVSNDGTYGFTGIFDGNGYSLSGFWVGFTDEYSMFGNVAESGVIRNVAFTDFTYRLGQYIKCGVLGHNFNGTLENVYIEAAINASSKGEQPHSPIAYSMAKAKLKDVVIKFDTTNLGTMKATYLAMQIGIYGGSRWYNMATFDNVYVFADGISKIDSYSNTVSNGLTTKGYDESATVTMTDGTYWTLTGSQPVWKGRS